MRFTYWSWIALALENFFSDFFQAIQCLMMDRYILQQNKLQNKWLNMCALSLSFRKVCLATCTSGQQSGSSSFSTNIDAFQFGIPPVTAKAIWHPEGVVTSASNWDDQVPTSDPPLSPKVTSSIHLVKMMRHSPRPSITRRQVWHWRSRCLSRLVI
jgi:hypothetical protein